MSPDEFNALVEEIIGGLPITIGLNRLVLIILGLIDQGGGAAADFFRQSARVYSDIDEGPSADDVGISLQGDGQ